MCDVGNYISNEIRALVTQPMIKLKTLIILFFSIREFQVSLLWRKVGTWYITYTDEVGSGWESMGEYTQGKGMGAAKIHFWSTLIFSRILMFTFTQMGTVDAGLELFLLCMQIQYFVFLWFVNIFLTQQTYYINYSTLKYLLSIYYELTTVAGDGVIS